MTGQGEDEGRTEITVLWLKKSTPREGVKGLQNILLFRYESAWKRIKREDAIKTKMNKREMGSSSKQREESLKECSWREQV